MALSILTNPTNSQKAGLWDSETGRYIYIGAYKNAEAQKHTIEQAQQEADNLKWLKDVYELRKKELTSAGISEKEAEKIIRYRIPKLHKAVKGL